MRPPEQPRTSLQQSPKVREGTAQLSGLNDLAKRYACPPVTQEPGSSQLMLNPVCSQPVIIATMQIQTFLPVEAGKVLPTACAAVL
jgi:hypothetical protein